ncbi:MAG: hypothetical protein LBT70_02910 [Holosporaceae bacterium]|jgi:hypothetical protein|nr:hypothetical protein [Holosporaceae bacterium]
MAAEIVYINCFESAFAMWYFYSNVRLLIALTSALSKHVMYTFQISRYTSVENGDEFREKMAKNKRILGAKIEARQMKASQGKPLSQRTSASN